MTKPYIMTVCRGGVQLYGGRLEEKGAFTVFEDFSGNTVKDFCDRDIPEGEKQETCLGIIFSPAYSYPEKENLLGILHQNGYTHVKELGFLAPLCGVIKGYSHALILSTDAEDLYAEYVNLTEKTLLTTEKLDGLGKDPRIEVLAECIWKKLIFEASYLNKEKDFGEVKEAARQFLFSQKSELDGTIYLEGENHDFFVRRRDADIENIIDHGSNGILSGLGNFVNKNQINKSETVLVLNKGLAGNRYFHDVFNGFMPETFEIEDKSYHALLNILMNDLQGIAIDTSPIGLSSLPLSHIHDQRGETSIRFDIQIPEEAYAVEVFRDGTPIRRITDSSFTDDNLQADHTYRYTFQVVYRNELGAETRSKETSKTLTTLKPQLPPPVDIHIQQTGQKAVIRWEQPERGAVRIYHSPKPFDLHRNDTIADIRAFDYPMLSSLEASYNVQKDFCGERYFMPVTVIDNMGIAGEQQSIFSIFPPRGVRVDATDVSHIKVIWIWDGIPMVRIKWVAEDGNENWQDIACDGQFPEFELPLASKSRHFTVSVSTLCTLANGKVQESEAYIQQVALSSIKVNFFSAKSEAKLFSHKDEYSVTLQADGEPPCDLYVLLEEGSMPLDLTNFKSHLTIPHQELADGTEKKFTFKYQRQQKKLPLYFRIIAADRSLPLRVVPETQKIK